MRGLRFFPAAEILDRQKLSLDELTGIFRRDLGIRGPIIVGRDDLLRLRAIEIGQIFARRRQIALGLRHLINHSYRRFRENGNRRRYHFKLTHAEFFSRQKRLILPCDFNVTDTAFNKGDGGPACAGIQDRHVIIKRLEIGACLAFVTIIGLQGPAIGGQIVPPRPARGFRIGGNHLHAGLGQISPVVNALGIAFAYQKHN